MAPRSRLDSRFLAGGVVIVVASFLLRLYGIGSQAIWTDEAFSWYAATTQELRHILLIDDSPPLYYLLLRAWLSLVGTTEATLRFPSAIAGTCFVATVLWTGLEIFNARVALWSGAVAALAPIHIYYSQEARAYACLVFFLLVSQTLVWRALRTNSWSGWMLASLSMLVAFYTHYFAALGLLSGVCLLWVSGERSYWRRYLAAALASALGFLPWVVWGFGVTARSGAAQDWIRPIWENIPPSMAIPRTLELFAIGGQAGLGPIFLKQFTTLEFPPALRVLGLTVLAILAFWVCAPWGDRAVGIKRLGERKAWLAITLALPLAVLWVVSFFLRPLYLPGRYDLVAFPAFPLIVGLALAKTQRAVPAGSIVAAVIALLLSVPIGSKLLRYYQAVPQFNYADATARVLDAEVANGDVVVFTGLRGLPTVYYLSRLGYQWDDRAHRVDRSERSFSCRLYPLESERMPGVVDARRILAAPDAVRTDVQAYLSTLSSPGGSVWVVMTSTHAEEGSRLLQELSRQGWAPLSVYRLLGIYRFTRT
ncbi:MAG TPA: glycosyltransferase family 39 protein [Candidatus Binatia bacterium]|nr:glycosyltransferase family 39 protein [Candidatus Binatia bacterium]